MKRITVFLTLILAFILSMGISAEDNTPRITATTNRLDNTVEITLNITKNSGIAGCSFNVVYDSKKLTYMSHEVKDIVLSTMYFVNPQYNANAVRVLWADGKALTSGGEIIKICFEIKDGASGTTDIVLDKLKMKDVSSTPVECSSEKIVLVISEDENDKDNTQNESSDKKHPYPTPPSPEAPDGDYDKDYEAFLMGFEDVNTKDWFYDSVKFSSYNRLLNGISEKEFAPNATLTRAMLVTVLYRLEGEPECSSSSFKDVKNGTWYSKGISWAEQNGIVNGIGNNMFAPNTSITREQIATVMYRYAKYKGVDVSVEKSTSLNSYIDAKNISKYAVESVRFAIGSGLIKGKTASTVNPLDNATRAEFATILKRFIETNKISIAR